MRIEEVLEVMTKRRSVRRFTAQPVSDEEIRALLEAAVSAPSASNRQAWRFLVVKNDDVKKQMADAVAQKAAAIRAAITDPDLARSFDHFSHYLTFFHEAPVVIAACAKRSPSLLERLMVKKSARSASASAELMSVSMALQNLQLAAHVLGLGSCCMTGPCIASDEIAAILQIPAPFELAAVIPVGHPDETPEAPERKDLALVSETIR